MTKRDIAREIRELETVTPSARLDDRIHRDRDTAIQSQTPSHPIGLSWAAIFGVGMGLAGFGIGFLVANVYTTGPAQSEVPDVQVRLILADQPGPSAFDFTQQADPPFGRLFEQGDTPQGVQQ